MSSCCEFIPENRRDIDFEIKKALGREGICGLVMTPKATYAGAYMDVGIAWQIDEFEIDIVENVQINRHKPLSADYMTALDAGAAVFDILCPLSGEHEGQWSPVSLEEGEDGGLVVVKCILKCLVHKTLVPAKTIV